MSISVPTAGKSTGAITVAEKLSATFAEGHSMVKPTSTVDVEVILSEKVGGVKNLQKLVEIKQEKGGENAIVMPKSYLRYDSWLKINRAVYQMGGTYKRKENLWLVPLNKNKH